MANITTIQEPQVFQTAYNDNVWVVDSINKSQTNFKYVADIIVDGNSFRQAIYPHPTYNYGVFNIGRVIENYIVNTLIKDDGFKENVGSIINYSIQFGEEYGLTSSGTTIYPNQLNKTDKYVWNGVFNQLEYNVRDYTDYVASPSNVAQYLTNSPTSGIIRDNEDAWLSALCNSSGTIYYAKIITYDSGGNVLQTLRIANPYQSVSSNNSKHIKFGCGTNNLNDINSSGIITGSQPIITASVVRYSVTFETFAGVSVTGTKWFTIDNTCTKNNTYRFHWLNKLGGWDSFTFIRGSRKNDSIERSSYKNNPNEFLTSTSYGASSKSFYNTDFEIKYKQNIRVLSDWINEATHVWLAELIKSPIVYLDDATYGLIAVNILNGNYEYKTTAQDKLFNLEVEFKYSFDSYSQRL
jgi:hypothetical protein